MNKVVIRPFNVVDNTELPEITADQIPAQGDPVEINKELYYVCENISEHKSDYQRIGLIPLVVRNPSEVVNIKDYLHCLSIAHRKVLFKNAKGNCDLESCDIMIIT